MALDKINTGTILSAATLAASSTDQALNILRAYIKDNTESIAQDTDTGLVTLDTGDYSGDTSRASEAAFYLACENYAVNILRLKIGVIGADPTTPLAEIIIQKAMALIEMSAQRLAAYEKYCATEAGIRGALYQGLITNAYQVSDSAAGIATSMWEAIPSDSATGIEEANKGDYLANIGLAVAMQLLGANVLQRKMGFSGARNPALAEYYANVGKILSDTGTEAVSRFIPMAFSTKSLSTMYMLGL